jgi:hypothetical protein
MVSKRGFLGFLSGLIAATFAPKTTLSDPKPKGKVYALAGERVTCENGHHICTFAQTVYIGDMQYPDTQFTDWQQSVPIHASHPVCAKCNAKFYTHGGILHIGTQWRDPLNLMSI